MKKLRGRAVMIVVAAVGIAWMISRWPAVEAVAPSAVSGGPMSLEPFIGPGEVMTFDLHVSPRLSIGTATLRLLPPEPLDDPPIHRAVASFNVIFVQTDDEMTSYIDPQIGAPRKFTKAFVHGRKHKVDTIEIDHEGLKAVHRRDIREYKDGKPEDYSYVRATIDVPAGVQDILSAYYHLRSIELSVGDEVRIPVTEDRKLHMMTLKVKGIETLVLPMLGAIEAFRIEPAADFKGLFGSEPILDEDGEPIDPDVKAVMWIDAKTGALLKVIAPVKMGGELTAELSGVSNTERPELPPIGRKPEDAKQ